VVIIFILNNISLVNILLAWRNVVAKVVLLTLMGYIWLLMAAGSVWAVENGFEYPYYLLDIYSPEGDCWRGMREDGAWPMPVIPEKWLVGPPPSNVSGVTLPTDCWVELKFRGIIVDGTGDDIFMTELGQCGEQALVFLINGAGQDYPVGIVTALDDGSQAPTDISLDISNIPPGLNPCALRLVALDLKGGSPGFDVGYVLARTQIICTDPASEPFPVDGAENVGTDTALSWLTGCSAEKHIVYFGDSPSDVGSDAMPVTEPQQPQDNNSYDPCELHLGDSYYWRIDEVNTIDGNNLSIGDIWKFIVTNHLIVDDFEFYNNINRLYDTWKQIGQAIIYTVKNPVRKCFQSMAFSYYCDVLFYSEAACMFDPPQDWSGMDAKSLELFFYGMQKNHVEGRLSLSLSDGDVNVVVPYEGDANNILEPRWHPWRINLSSLSNIDLSRIESITIGFHNISNEPLSYSSGTIYIDSISLYGARCFEENSPVGDINGDCIVDIIDFDEMIYNWLQSYHNTYVVKEPNAPMAWYKFDGDTSDSMGGIDAQLHGNVVFVPGVHGQGIEFDGKQTYVRILDVDRVFREVDRAISIAFWQLGADSGHRMDTVCCSNYVYGSGGPAVSINLGCWRQPGRYCWDCGQPWSLENRISGEHRYKSEWCSRWNHWVFTKDSRKGRMEIFLNGTLYDSKDGAYSTIPRIESFDIGSGWYGGYDGVLDDFRIYDYALSEQEVAYIATDGDGVLDQPLFSLADLNGDGLIEFGDFALLANAWLKKQLWP
jgi:hypothetical protein